MRSMGETSKKKMRKVTNSDPETNPHVSDEQEGSPSSRLKCSREPTEDEEKRRVGEKLIGRKRAS
jgi:hypothetical protein